MPIVKPNYSNLNYEEVAAEIGLKVKHMPMLISSFLEESKTIMQSLGDAIDANKYEDIKLHAHSIKGSAGNLRFNAIYDMAREMELSATKSTEDFDYKSYLNAIREAINTISL